MQLNHSDIVYSAQIALAADLSALRDDVAPEDRDTLCRDAAFLRRVIAGEAFPSNLAH